MKVFEIRDELCNIRDIIEVCYEALINDKNLNNALLKSKISHVLWFQAVTKLEIMDENLAKLEEIEHASRTV
jgi:hypothetical protein